MMIDKKKQRPLIGKIRRLVFSTFLLGLLLTSIFRLVYIYAEKSQFYIQQGNLRSIKKETIPAQRGIIRDTNGEVLALTTILYSVGVNLEHLRLRPQMSTFEKKSTQERITKFKDNLTFIQKHTKRSSNWFARQVFAANDKLKFRYINTKLPPETAKALKARAVPALVYQRKLKRFYPQGEILANVIGFADYQDNGRSGIEATFNRQLGGYAGKGWVRKDQHGNIISNISEDTSASRGSDLTLSIDRRVQEISFFALNTALKKHRAKKASVIVLNAKTGEVLSMVNLPSYNPNDSTQRVSKGVKNIALDDVFEPGSVMKPFTLLAALESGNINANTILHVGPGAKKSVKIARKTYRDSMRIKGESINLTTLIKKSSNVGAIKVALKMSAKNHRTYLNLFGFGEQTGIQMKTDKTGVLRPHKTWSKMSRTSAAIGYGLSSTLAQLARAYTIFSNDGQLLSLSILKLDEKPQGRQVVSKKFARLVRDLLRSTVADGGTATRARIKGYEVAGKTGTVQKIIKGKYQKDRHTALFVGMAPASNPKLVVAVMVDDPRGKRHGGGSVAAPVFAEIAAKTLAYLGVKPKNSANGLLALRQRLEK